MARGLVVVVVVMVGGGGERKEDSALRSRAPRVALQTASCAASKYQGQQGRGRDGSSVVNILLLLAVARGGIEQGRAVGPRSPFA
jgi:hypothetical protein